jgi:hypothetical protein
MLFSRHEATESHTVVRKRKFDGSVKSEWEGDLLSLLIEQWLVVLHHPERHRKVTGEIVKYAGPLFLHCFSIIEPLTVLIEYDRHGWFRGAKCDAALPATQVDNVIEFVDLDLDVIVKSDLSCSVRDETVFAQNRETMDYPETVVQSACRGILLAQALVTSRQFPFDERFVPRLNATLSLTDDAAYPI